MEKINRTAEQYRILKLAEEKALEGDAASANALLGIAGAVGELPAKWRDKELVIKFKNGEDGDDKPIVSTVFAE